MNKYIVPAFLLCVMLCNNATAQLKLDKIVKDKKDKIKEKAEGKTNDAKEGKVETPIESDNNTSVSDMKNDATFNGTSYAVKTFVGSGFQHGTYNANGYKDEQGRKAIFNKPVGICSDESGNLFVADCDNHCIRKITSDGKVSTFAGTSEQGTKNGIGTEARFFRPTSISYDGKAFYVTETENNSIRKITKEGKVTSIIRGGDLASGYKDGAFGTAQFGGPVSAVANSKGEIFILDRGNNCIRKIDDNGVSTFAGSPRTGYKDGKGEEAQFDTPFKMIIDSKDNLYVLELAKHHIRKITPDGEVTTFANFTDLNSGSSAWKEDIYKLDVFESFIISKDGSFYIADGSSYGFHKVSSDGKKIEYMLTGRHCSNYEGGNRGRDSEVVDGDDCKNIIMSQELTGICQTPDGKIYFIDKGYCCIRELYKK